jgi:hypothetical protein
MDIEIEQKPDQGATLVFDEDDEFEEFDAEGEL